MIYLIDSYAWIEYFIGSLKGAAVQKLFLDEKNRFLTVECCLAEIKGWALRESKDFDPLLKIILANSTIVVILQHDWLEAAAVRFEQRKQQKDFGLIDAIILVKQKEHNGIVVSGDRHFKELKNVLFLAEIT